MMPNFTWAMNNPVGYWLMAVYAYEELDQSLMEDAEFDKLAVWLEENWLDVMHHPHAKYIDPLHTKGRLGLTVPMNELPTTVFCAAHQLMDGHYGRGKWGAAGRSYNEMMAVRFPAPKPKDWSDLC